MPPRGGVVLETYIFDRDPIGLRFADALIEAARRGVAVRVLVDAVGARYSVPSIVGRLREGGVTTRVFNGRIITGLRLPTPISGRTARSSWWTAPSASSAG